MKNPFWRYKGFWPPERKRSMYLGIVLLVLAIIVQFTLGPFGSRHAMTAAPAGDIFLDNLPVVNLTGVIVFWTLALWVLAWCLLVTRPQYLIFGTKAIAVYIMCRAFFVSLTHIGPYPINFSPSPENIGFHFYQLWTYQGNFFFSGHTAFPFLMALIFWDEKIWRRFFLFLSFFFGLTVLLAHVHYSIDVFAAPFITYATFVATARMFHDDYKLLPGERPGLPA
ncbi:MAG TPA: phosphatase PAP2-related protein [Candidatus Paceibacterota bacterium]|nr:phosphatase PAP2-related protein [Candidatus Paceibacterota bacterium]